MAEVVILDQLAGGQIISTTPLPSPPVAALPQRRRRSFEDDDEAPPVSTGTAAGRARAPRRRVPARLAALPRHAAPGTGDARTLWCSASARSRRWWPRPRGPRRPCCARTTSPSPRARAPSAGTCSPTAHPTSGSRPTASAGGSAPGTCSSPRRCSPAALPARRR
ncbi:hypothetical protein BS78_06G060400 [Paspalum vaginatum]|nr:hypothetical protein BS78_06G060400 [Paspalum vaginatum]